MLRRYSIHNFKSFEQITLNLGSLNLFAGANSTGKSTAIQALLLAADNLQTTAGIRGVTSVHIPPMTFNETRNYLTNAKEYAIALLSDEGSEVKMKFSPADDAFQRINMEQTGVPSQIQYEQLCWNIMYLSATRTWQLYNTTINPYVDKNPLGMQGEYIIDHYYNHHEDLIPEDLVFSPSATQTLETQVNHWLHTLTGYRLSVEPDSSRYKVRFITNDGKELLPYHVGTGISFITELIITCLSARNNSLIVIENPEIHLHPSAQADLIDFLAKVSCPYRQIIIESHSVHFFNGIRRLLHNNIIFLPDVSVYNFIRDEQGMTYANQVFLSQQGGIKNYEPGMFEQFDKDLDAILS